MFNRAVFEQNLNNEIQQLLIEYPLYRKKEIPNALNEIWEWNRKRVNCYCEFDKTEQTFELRLPIEYETFYGNKPGDKPARPFNWQDYNRNINFVFHLEGVCAFCQKYKVDFMVNVFTESPAAEGTQFYARKIGAFPPFEISPGRDILNYLTKEHQDFYKKGLMNFSTGYGIGAFAYFRRITEDVIKHTITDVIKLELAGKEEVEKALNEYNNSHSMSKLLDSVTPYLPKALLDVGDNPLRLLYESASSGLHELSEEECMRKAELIDTLLRFVISQMNEEGGRIKKVKEAIKSLRK